MTPRRFSATSRKASRRPRHFWTATTRSPSRWRPTTPTNCWPRWASCRNSWIIPVPGIWRASSSRPWTHCAARRRNLMSRCCRAVSAAASRCAAYCWPSPIFCCWTSRLTIWMPRASSGWSSTWRSTRAPWSPSLTIATSSTTSQAGSWSWTAAGPIRMKATTPPIWRPRRPGSKSRVPRTLRSASASRTSWSGSGRARGPGRRRAGRACSGMKRWLPRLTGTASSTSRRSRSRRVRGWAPRSSRPRA